MGETTPQPYSIKIATGRAILGVIAVTIGNVIVQTAQSGAPLKDWPTAIWHGVLAGLFVDFVTYMKER